MGFENIVRPFQLPQNTPGRLIDSGQKTDEPVTLSIGNSGVSFKQMNGSISSTITLYLGKSDVELKY